MNIQTLIILACLPLITAATSCQNPATKFSIISVDTTTKADFISFENLAQNSKNYHGKYIDTKGLFGQSFEHFGLCPDTLQLSKHPGCFWLDLNPDLKLNHDDLRRMNGKVIRLKGLVDTTRKGHVNSYLATISDIYFWEQQP
jgi:hypothetical protein